MKGCSHWLHVAAYTFYDRKIWANLLYSYCKCLKHLRSSRFDNRAVAMCLLFCCHPVFRRRVYQVLCRALWFPHTSQRICCVDQECGSGRRKRLTQATGTKEEGGE